MTYEFSIKLTKRCQKYKHFIYNANTNTLQILLSGSSPGVGDILGGGNTPGGVGREMISVPVGSWISPVPGGGGMSRGGISGTKPCGGNNGSSGADGIAGGSCDSANKGELQPSVILTRL